jgi:hypothetical protein
MVLAAPSNQGVHQGTRAAEIRAQQYDEQPEGLEARMIDKEVFCEGHKEVIIETFGVDHFPIHRLTNEDDAFAIGGRFPKPNPKQRGGDNASKR